MYLVERGADFRARARETSTWAYENKHFKIIDYLNGIDNKDIKMDYNNDFEHLYPFRRGT